MRGHGFAATATRTLRVAVLVVLALLASLFLIAGGGTRPAAAATPGPVVGVQFHGTWSSYTDTSRAMVLDKLKASGASTVRIDVSWNMLEPTASGVYSAWGLAQVDNVINMAASRGLRPLVTLWMAPKWANGSTDERVAPTSAKGLAGLTSISRRLAVRYKGVVDGWEVWNEPNDTNFMRGASPVVYAGILRAAYAGFKAGDPTSTVVFSGTVCVDDVWINRALAAGAKGKYDVMGVHPYMAVADEAPDLPDNGTKYRMNHLPALLQVMAKYGEGSKQVWFTEFGWSVHPTLAGSANEARGVTAAQQADYLRRTINLVRAKYPQVTKIFWYQDRTDGTDPATSGYGLIFPNGTTTPALAQLFSYLNPTSVQVASLAAGRPATATVKVTKPAPPKPVKVTASRTTAAVRWTPSTTSKVKTLSYLVQIRKVGSTSVKAIRVPATTTAIRIPVQPGATYRVGVSGTGSTGTGTATSVTFLAK